MRRTLSLCFFFSLIILSLSSSSQAAPPTVVITSPAAGFTNDNTPLLVYTVDDPAATVAVKVDGVVVPKVSGDSLDTLPDGQHTVRVEAVNAATETGSAEVNFTVDTAPPLSIVITKIAAGRYHTAAVKSNGTLWSWGNNVSGQLGIGTTVNGYSPLQVGAETDWSVVSAGNAHTVAFKANGTLWAWGDNAQGQVGDASYTQRTRPVPIGSDAWKAIAAGGQHTLAVKTDGTLWAWGYNASGQLGDGGATNRNSPFLVNIADNTGWIAVAAGAYHSVALKEGGKLYAWGFNAYGQLGDGSYTDSAAPVRIGTDADHWVAVAAGGYHTLALKSDGSLWAWGYNGYGQLGINNYVNKNVPNKIIAVPEAVWSYLAAGANHSLAIKSDGTLWTWGYNGYGQLGDGTTTGKTAPVKIEHDTNWSSVAGGLYHTVALKTDGAVMVWGNNGYGQLGDTVNVNKTSPVQIRSDVGWSAIGSGASNHSMALMNDGSLWAWGYNFYGQLGDGTSVNKSAPVPIKTNGSDIDYDWAAVAVGGAHTAALKSNGSLWAWGWNGYGQLGDRSYMNRNTPVPIKSNGIDIDTDWIAVAAGTHHTVALKSDGSLWAWGYNAYGQLGNGTFTNSNTPVQAGTEKNWLKLAVGGHHVLALKSDGTLWTWGYNGWGQLGNNATANSAVPVRLTGNPTGDDNWASVAAGTHHSFGLKQNGELYAWGANDAGQLGDNTTVSRKIPVLIGSEVPWSKISAGRYHTAALKTNGGLWTWGENFYGQLGDGTLVKKARPFQVGTETSWTSVAAGYLHTLALKASGTLWAWGYNADGELGNGATGSVAAPLEIDTLGNITINNGATYVKNASVTLTLNAADASGLAGMQFSNDNITWSDPEAPALSRPWNLNDPAYGGTATDGTKTVYVKFRDLAGNWTLPFKDTIILDTAPPVVTITSPTAVPTKDDTPLLTYTVSDTSPVVIVVKVDGNIVYKVSGESLDVLTNGPHTVRVEAADAVEYTGSDEVNFTVDTTMNLAFVGTVSTSSHAINTQTAEYSTISYTINGPATTTLKIIPEKQGPTGTPVFQASRNCDYAGTYYVVWDGKDNTGKVVPDEAYLYILEAADGTQTAAYSPGAPTCLNVLGHECPVSFACSQDTYNPYKNDPLTVSYTVAQPSRIDLTIAWGSSPFKTMDAAPHVAGSYTYDWDGRNPIGKILGNGGVAKCAVASLLRENNIITTGDTVKISSLTIDPYEMHLSYGQFTRIAYYLSREADVTVMLISPNGGETILKDNQRQTAGSHTAMDENAPIDLLNTSGNQFVVSEEGDYMVSVQAVNPTSGTSAIYRGSLKIEQ